MGETVYSQQFTVDSAGLFWECGGLLPLFLRLPNMSCSAQIAARINRGRKKGRGKPPHSTWVDATFNPSLYVNAAQNSRMRARADLTGTAKGSAAASSSNKITRSSEPSPGRPASARRIG